MKKPPTGQTPVTAEETITALIRQSQRKRVPLRRTFVQKGPQEKPKRGPLASFVTRHDMHALDLYLLALAVATAAPYDVRQSAAVWARALGLNKRGGLGLISRAWRRLARRKLITRGRKGRKANIRLLMEDGSGAAYRPPGLTKKKSDVYMQIPLAYWLGGHHARLSLPAKAMLLIALSLGETFQLPTERAKAWYGLSADTAERGLWELVHLGILHREPRWVRAPLTPEGFTRFYDYTLHPPFRRRRPPPGG